MCSDVKNQTNEEKLNFPWDRISGSLFDCAPQWMYFIFLDFFASSFFLKEKNSLQLSVYFSGE